MCVDANKLITIKFFVVVVIHVMDVSAFNYI